MARRKLLTPDERQTLLGIPDDEESLIRHYTLSPQDRLQAEVRRRPHNQLGYAVQLCIMRYPGRVLGMGEDPPAAMVSYVAEQLGITPGAFAFYARRTPTRFEHSHRLAKYLGVRTATRDDRRAALLAAAEAAGATENGLPIMTAIVNELRRRGVLLLPMRRSRRSALPAAPLLDNGPKPLFWTDSRQTRWSSSRLSSWSTQPSSRPDLRGYDQHPMLQAPTT